VRKKGRKNQLAKGKDRCGGSAEPVGGETSDRKKKEKNCSRLRNQRPASEIERGCLTLGTYGPGHRETEKNREKNKSIVEDTDPQIPR